MRTLYIFAAVALLAACKGKPADANTASNTTTNGSTANTAAANTNANPIAAHADKIAECLCPHLDKIAAIVDKAQTAPAEERAAFEKEIDDYPEPPCVGELDAHQKTMKLTAAQEAEMESLMNKAIHTRCGASAQKIGMPNQ